MLFLLGFCLGVCLLLFCKALYIWWFGGQSYKYVRFVLVNQLHFDLVWIKEWNGGCGAQEEGSLKGTAQFIGVTHLHANAIQIPQCNTGLQGNLTWQWASIFKLGECHYARNDGTWVWCLSGRKKQTVPAFWMLDCCTIIPDWFLLTRRWSWIVWMPVYIWEALITQLPSKFSR